MIKSNTKSNYVLFYERNIDQYTIQLTSMIRLKIIANDETSFIQCKLPISLTMVMIGCWRERKCAQGILYYSNSAVRFWCLPAKIAWLKKVVMVFQHVPYRCYNSYSMASWDLGCEKIWNVNNSRHTYHAELVRGAIRAKPAGFSYGLSQNEGRRNPAGLALAAPRMNQQ